MTPDERLREAKKMKFCSTCKHAEFYSAGGYFHGFWIKEDRCTHPDVRARVDEEAPVNPVRPTPPVDYVDCADARKPGPCGPCGDLHEEGERVDIVRRKKEEAEPPPGFLETVFAPIKPWWRFW